MGRKSGYSHSEETKRKIGLANSIALLGNKHTDETRRTMSKNHANVFGINNPFFGKHHSEESLNKMREVKGGENHPLFGKHRSEETKRKLSEINSGENGPNYKNGVNSKKSNYLRLANYVCENCGKTIGYCKECNRANYALHHKDRNRLNNVKCNLQVLCYRCHMAAHHDDRVKRNKEKKHF